MSYDRPAFLNALRASPGLSDAAVRLALVLDGYGGADGLCWPSQRLMANDCGWSLEKTKRVVKELLKAGVISYERRARHKRERSSIRLIGTGVTRATGVTDDTGSEWGTGVTDDTEPVSPVTRTGVTDDTQNQPMNQSSEPTHVTILQNGTSTSTKWPDGWTKDHPKVDAYVSVLRRLEARLPKEWDVLKAEGPQVQKLRNAAAKAAEEGVDPYRLANIVTAKPLDGLSSYSAGLAKRIEDTVPTIAGGGPDAS